MKQTFIETVQDLKYFTDNVLVPNATEQDKQSLRSGSLITIPGGLVHRKEVAGFSANQALELLEPDNIFKRGVSDFDGVKLKVKNNMIAKGIRIGYQDAAAITPGTADYAYHGLPAGLRNGRLVIIQDNRVRLSIDAGLLTREGEPGDDNGFYQLPSWIMLAADTDTKIQFIPAGAIAIANVACMSIEFEGWVTTPA